MNFIIENWFIVAVLLSVVVLLIYFLVKFLKKPTKEQVENLRHWLLIAVTEAERELGEKTGQLKLRLVYDWALDKFPWLVFISFDKFANWVDEALDKLEDLLDKNEAVKTYVEHYEPIEEFEDETEDKVE